MSSSAERDVLVGEVAVQVMRVVEEINERWGEVLLRAGLSGSHLTLLRRLVDEGPTSMSGVAEHLGCDPSLATVAVDRLEARQLVRRVADPRDRRVRRVEIAPRGVDVVREVWAEMAARTAVGRLDDAQLTTLKALLAQMVRPGGQLPGAQP